MFCINWRGPIQGNESTRPISCSTPSRSASSALSDNRAVVGFPNPCVEQQMSPEITRNGESFWSHFMQYFHTVFRPYF